MPVPPPVSSAKTVHTTYKHKRKLWGQRFAKLAQQREDLEQQIAAESEDFRQIQQPLTSAAVQRRCLRERHWSIFWNMSTCDQTRKRREQRYPSDAMLRLSCAAMQKP